MPVKALRERPTFSPLFFADDPMLFVKADHVNCSTIRDLIDSFYATSG